MLCRGLIEREAPVSLAWLIVVVVAISSGVAGAQDTAPAEGAPPPKLREPEAVTLTTKDDLQLKVTYYGGTKGKLTVPVVILHDFKSNRNAFVEMAKILQARGFAVLVPDLRGHGLSTRFVDATGMGIEAAKMRRDDFGDIIEFDMEAIRKFLVTKNDEGELNLNSLCLVGSEMGAVMAVNWTAKDWGVPPLATGKQGQDVKALVLVSPDWSFKGVPIRNALGQPVFQSNAISLLILMGQENAKAKKNADRLFSSLRRWHPDPQDPEAFAEVTLWLEAWETSLQGVKLLDAYDTVLKDFIADFFQWRSADLQFEWTRRRTVE